MNARAVVFGCRTGDVYRAGRTLGALRRAGLETEDGGGPSATGLAALLASEGAPVWLVRAGAWPVRPGPLCLPPPSATGLPLCALGWTRVPAEADPARDGEARLWAALQAETGGDFATGDRGGRLPPVASAFLEAPAVAALARRLEQGEGVVPALAAELGSGRYRVVHAQALDVYDDPALRVVQVVTSLQRGGAERVTLDLAEELGRAGTSCRVVTLGDPTRAAFPAPPGTVSLARADGGRPERLRRVAEAARSFAADLVHGHLLGREDAAALAAAGLPLLLTVHNMRPGWPAGLAEIGTGEAALLVACARAVEDDLRAARVPVPIRTVWNGIDFAACPRTPGRVEAGRRLRQRLGLGPTDLVLLAVANPRPQKRLHLLPAILAATRAELARRGDPREVCLLLAGEASRVSREAAEAVAAVRAEVARLGVSEYGHWLGAVEDLTPVLMAGDVLVSASAYEGLSLAQIEALAAELPVVATDAGGTAELARGNPAVSVLPSDAHPEQWARTLADVCGRRLEGGRPRRSTSRAPGWRSATAGSTRARSRRPRRRVPAGGYGWSSTTCPRAGLSPVPGGCCWTWPPRGRRSGRPSWRSSRSTPRRGGPS
jgi:glycosyltransferase involved in cell wall biosynthesis